MTCPKRVVHFLWDEADHTVKAFLFAEQLILVYFQLVCLSIGDWEWHKCSHLIHESVFSNYISQSQLYCNQKINHSVESFLNYLNPIFQSFQWGNINKLTNKKPNQPTTITTTQQSQPQTTKTANQQPYFCGTTIYHFLLLFYTCLMTRPVIIFCCQKLNTMSTFFYTLVLKIRA